MTLNYEIVLFATPYGTRYFNLSNKSGRVEQIFVENYAS